ncbi:(d)CMP kinase [Haliovirga abyssi]|uniref:Cytidylate kinase n=1 Tax=Haliovirga abyssi TaxID=2996794 RepID=A0AAU9D4W2_9FUSO|nr:(d)CMP kinase [Haliovirga abyssi]BDU51004.1 cytidylate kinase [Haliovirga abyssi]
MEFIVAIDGPAGSGKSTIAKLLSDELGFVYLDTGAMYRAISLKVIQNKIDLSNLDEIENMLKNTILDIKDKNIILDKKDVSDEIRGREVSNFVSKVATVKLIREEMVRMQREISKGKRVILDGRDIGTVVFPNANLKIFLNATALERAKRRLLDYKKQGIGIEIETVLEEIKKRDKMDTERENSPLVKALDAIEIDTTDRKIEHIKNEILGLINKMIIDKIVVG